MPSRLTPEREKEMRTLASRSLSEGNTVLLGLILDDVFAEIAELGAMLDMKQYDWMIACKEIDELTTALKGHRLTRDEYADEIASLRARVEKLRAALLKYVNFKGKCTSALAKSTLAQDDKDAIQNE